MLTFLILLRFGELTSELLANRSDVLVSLDMVPLNALVKLPVANRAEVAGMPISLLQVVCALHEALVPSTVAQSEHVAEFVGSDLANSHEHGIFCLL